MLKKGWCASRMAHTSQDIYPRRASRRTRPLAHSRGGSPWRRPRSSARRRVVAWRARDGVGGSIPRGGVIGRRRCRVPTKGPTHDRRPGPASPLLGAPTRGWRPGAASPAGRRPRGGDRHDAEPGRPAPVERAAASAVRRPRPRRQVPPADRRPATGFRRPGASRAGSRRASHNPACRSMATFARFRAWWPTTGRGSDVPGARGVAGDPGLPGMPGDRRGDPHRG